ncbi:hypothetical protein GCM10020221_00300 [Streptomyces thioluteus]|uniref:Uncharacterized protein n=1 Tax=Streptomyces thioluteus TaxID=66431 RepID=A0ABN3W9J0_STRTU
MPGELAVVPLARARALLREAEPLEAQLLLAARSPGSVRKERRYSEQRASKIGVTEAGRLWAASRGGRMPGM